MRTAAMTINGREHILCFSARVVRDCAERYGEWNGVFAAMSEGTEVQKLDESIWLISRLMDAGARYAAANGIECPKALTPDELYDSCSLSDFFMLRNKITETVKAGQQTTVEAEAPKNGAATPAVS